MKRDEHAPDCELLQKLAKEQGWTQTDVHHLTGLSRGLISDLWRGKKARVNAGTRFALATLFGVSPEKLRNSEDQGSTADPSSISSQNNLRLFLSLYDAIRQEFDGACLHRRSAEQSLESIRSLVQGMHPKHPEFWGSFQPSRFDTAVRRPLQPNVLPPQSTLKPLRKRRIRFSTNAMECGTVAALTLIDHHLREEGIQLDVDVRHVHGGDVVSELNRQKKYCDFGNLGVSPMILDLSRSRKSAYELVAPIHVAAQCVYAHDSDTSKLKSVYYLEGGSGELQRQRDERLPSERGGYNRDVIEDRLTFGVAKHLERGEGVIAYTALGNSLAHCYQLMPVANTTFDIHSSLWVNKETIGKNFKATEAFLTLFRWAYATCQRKPLMALDLLRDNERYLRLYAAGAKILIC